MENQTIEVSLRNELGSSAVRRLRKTGKVPAVVYGEGKEAIPVTIDLRQYRKVVARASNPIYKTKSDQKSLNDLTVFIKDESLEPLKDLLLHVDFLSIHEGQEISLEVPVEIVGECPAVKQGFAVLNQTVHDVEVTCLPINIPRKFVVDVSELKAAHAILASEIVLPHGVKLKISPETAIVSAIIRRAEEEVKPAVAAATDAAAAPAAAATATKDGVAAKKEGATAKPAAK